MTTEKIKYLGINSITSYDALIKNYIDTADAASIKGVGLDGTTLNLYTDTAVDASPAYQIVLPTSDVSALMSLVADAVENDIAVFGADGQVIDSGKAFSDFVQSVTSGETNGTISVDGEEVAVAGLGSAAYTDADAYDAAGAADAVKDEIDAEIGDMSTLATTAQSDLVSAINEVSATVTSEVVAISTDSTTEGYAKTYTVTQGGTTIGTIDIPVDLVVTAGAVVVDPDGMEEGTYIALTIANDSSDIIYINVGDLVDIYTAEGSAAQVQLTISADNVISAAIVDGSVGTAALADSAVTLAKLSDEVQASLAKADTAVQSVSAGSADGTIAVDGTDVAVTGLGSAAYTSADAYDAAGAADDALTSAKEYADEISDSFEEITEDDIAALFE